MIWTLLDWIFVQLGQLLVQGLIGFVLGPVVVGAFVVEVVVGCVT